jgi:hypothetical protein
MSGGTQLDRQICGGSLLVGRERQKHVRLDLRDGSSVSLKIRSTSVIFVRVGPVRATAVGLVTSKTGPPKAAHGACASDTRRQTVAILTKSDEITFGSANREPSTDHPSRRQMKLGTAASGYGAIKVITARHL